MPVVLEERGEPAQEFIGTIRRVERAEHRVGVGLKRLRPNGVEQQPAARDLLGVHVSALHPAGG